MFANPVFRSKGLAFGLTAAFVLLVAPVRDFAQAKAPAPAAASAGASIVGFIYAKDMTTPVQSVVVKIRNVQSPKEYSSQPTDANGMYKIVGIAEGRYILGVATAKGNFNFDYVLVLKGNEMAKLSVALEEGGKTTGKDAEAKSFFSSPENVIGVALFVAGMAFMTYLILHKPSEASPIR